MKFRIGREYPVWWDTGDGRPAGQHRARILDVLEYTGRYAFSCVLKLSAPETRRGYMEMAVK